MSRPLRGCAQRLVDTACCALIKSGVLRQLDGFAVPLADTREFFRFVYSAVAASDDDVRRSALEHDGPLQQGVEPESAGASGTRPDRVLRAAAAAKQAASDEQEVLQQLKACRESMTRTS